MELVGAHKKALLALNSVEELSEKLSIHGDHALTETRHFGKSSQPHEEVHAQF